jgi:hypothetical protein
LGVPKAEIEAIGLLPERMADAYTTSWDKPLLDLIDRQTALPWRPAYCRICRRSRSLSRRR